MREQLEKRIQTLVSHAWDREIRWAEVEEWLLNFQGEVLDVEKERDYALFALTKFMYFGKRQVREMLRSLYRDHFEAPIIQRIRRNYGNTRDSAILRSAYKQELRSTRFIGVGNPAESGAHLLYFFRQVNRLPKDLFCDVSTAFVPTTDRNSLNIVYRPQDNSVTRYVFFDDLVGSGTQASDYLSRYLIGARSGRTPSEISYMSLFGTSTGLARLNSSQLFNGNAMALFELDETYRSLEVQSRHFIDCPDWFNITELKTLMQHYGTKLRSAMPLGYKNGQLLLAFSHNTPDNSPPIFWDEGTYSPWTPLFLRYDKMYGG